MKKLLTTAVSALALAATAGAATAADEIRILAPTWLGFAPVHIAQDLGASRRRISTSPSASRTT